MRLVLDAERKGQRPLQVVLELISLRGLDTPRAPNAFPTATLFLGVYGGVGLDTASVHPNPSATSLVLVICRLEVNVHGLSVSCKRDWVGLNLRAVPL